MGRFKTPAPAPPTTPYTKTPLRSQSKTPKISHRNGGGGSNINTLSLVAAFDDLVRNGNVFLEGSEDKCLVHVRAASDWRKRCKLAEAERLRISNLLIEKDKELSGKDYQIRQARTFVEDEQKSRLRAEAERDELSNQLQTIKNLLLADGGKTLNNETIERIRTLERIGSVRRDKRNGSITGGVHGSPARAAGSQMQHGTESSNVPPKPGMAAIEESAESLLDASDLSFDDTQGDILDGSRPLRSGRRRSSANIGGNRRSAIRRSAGDGTGLVTKTTVVVGQDGETHAESFIETFDLGKDIKNKVKRTRKSRERRSAVSQATHTQFQHHQNQAVHQPSAPPLQNVYNIQYDAGLPPKTPSGVITPTIKRTFSNAASVASRPHCFQKKNVVIAEKCHPCGRRIKFGKQAYKCRDCAVVCHLECKHNAPMPCIAGGNRTPTNKTGNYLADYTPSTPPMIPALLIHCITDVEERGVDEVGIYRVPGNEAEANELLEKFTKMARSGYCPPRLAKYEVHVVTSCIKKFLRSLKEPIIPLSLWQVFVDAASNPDTTDIEAAMYQAVSELPKPNCDTLAYLMIHLQTVASNHKANKMDIDNLAKVIGPTIVGYSSSDPMAIISEAAPQRAVMTMLLNLSADYWSTFLAAEQENILGFKLTPTNTHKTPLSYAASGGIHTGVTPDQPIFNPPMASTTTYHGIGHTPLTAGPVARRTRSKQLHEQFSKKQTIFQSPMLL